MRQRSLPGVELPRTPATGKNYEAEVKTANQVYALRKLADVEQLPNAWVHTTRDYFDRTAANSGSARTVARTASGEYLRREQSDLDFYGVLRGGRYIHFDAKSTGGASFPLANVEKHQVERLMRSWKMGALSGLNIHFWEKERTFFAPAPLVDKAYFEMLYRKARKSIAIGELETGGSEIFYRNNIWDWLEAVAKL